MKKVMLSLLLLSGALAYSASAQEDGATKPKCCPTQCCKEGEAKASAAKLTPTTSESKICCKEQAKSSMQKKKATALKGNIAKVS